MITKKEVEHIAKLARLGLTQDEVEKFQKQLSSVLDYMDKLKEANVSGIDITSHFLEKGAMREDRAKQQPVERIDKLLKAAPERKGRHIKVKTILSKT